MKIRAKAKVKKQRREAVKRLEENSGPLENKGRAYEPPSPRKTIPTGELRNVIAETVKRVYLDEFGVELSDLVAREGLADRIAWAMKYGGWNEDGYTKLDVAIPMKDHNYRRIPLCREHKRK